MLKEENLAIIAITIIIILSSGLFALTEQWTLFPTFFLTCITAVFSFLAYRHTKEKFRLDLMEKRLYIYDQIVKFCGAVVSTGTLHATQQNEKTVEQAHTAAHESFRGMGWHKTQLLFQKDIQDLADELSQAYSFLVSYSNYSSTAPDYYERVKERSDKLKIILDINSKLPDIFKPYIYFGDYKN